MNNIPSAFLPPWPEWSDTEVNAEKWNLIDGGSPKKKTSGKQKDVQRQVQQEISSFADPCGHGVLPPELEVVDWKRPKEINPNVNFTVVSNLTAPSDVFSKNNFHLLRSNVIQSILMSILWIEKQAESSTFPVEFQGPKFQFPLTSWKPWHHVYSNCKITKNAVHKPEYNSNGKYFVRLFFIGMWRRITVDDYLPVGVDGKVLLPLAKDPRNLWLPLLCKALLRIALITDTNSVVGNLTGWLRISISFPFVDEEPLWKAFVKLKEENLDNTDNNIRMCVTTESLQCVNDSLPMSCASVAPSLIVMDFENPIVRGGSHYAASSMVFEVYDDLSYIKAKEELQNKRWKKFRWENWAVRHGLIKDIEKSPGRKVMLFGPMFCIPVAAPEQPLNGSFFESPPDKDFYKWYFLNELAENLRMLHIYYKPSEFEHSCNISNINDYLFSKSTEKKGNSKKSDKGSAKSKSAKSKSAHGQSEIPNRSSGCFYIVSDSLFCKSIYITCSGYCDADKLRNTCYFIVGEKFSWKLSSTGKFLFSIETYRTTTIQLLLGSGLQAVRVWYSLPTNYCINVLSKTPFALCRKEKAQELLSVPSVTEKLCATTSSKAFKALPESTGSPLLHGQALKEFMESLTPIYFYKQLSSWNERFKKELLILEAFEEITIELLINKHTSLDSLMKALCVLQKLFLNPQFGRKYLKKIIPDFTDKLGLSSNISLEQQIADIENKTASVKDVVEMKPDKKTAKGSKKENSKEEGLVLDSPENMVSLFRKLIEKCPDVQKYYSFNDCVRSQLAYVDYNGSTEVKLSGKILFLIRYVFNVSNSDPMPFAFHVFTAMEKLVVNIINNDISEELPFGLSENSTYFLPKNNLGYTVFAYGELDTSTLPPKQVEMPWKLRLLGSVEHKLPHSFSPFRDNKDSPPSSIKPLHFEGLYLPEKDNIFCRCVLKITGNTAVTLHLISSSDSACITLKLKGRLQNCVAEAEGIHEVIIPLIFLNETDGIPSVDDEGVIFTVEGHVVKDSWVLSDETITALRNLREMRNEAGVKRLKKSSRKSSIIGVPGAELLPTWLLSAVFDSGDVSNHQLLPDTQSEDEIRRQKESWISKDESRRLKGLQAKTEFLSNFPEDYFEGKQQKLASSRKTASKESLCTRSEISMTEVAQASRTESLIAELSQQYYDKRNIGFKEEFPSATIEEMIENTYQSLNDKLTIGLQFEDNLKNKLAVSEKNFANVSEYKSQIIKEIQESLLPPKPQKKGKRTASPKK